MAEILHFEILRKHGQTNTQTNRHGHYNTSPSPYGGRGKYPIVRENLNQCNGPLKVRQEHNQFS